MSSENPLTDAKAGPYEGLPTVPVGCHGDGLALPKIVLKMEQTRRRYVLRKKVEKRIAETAIPGKKIAQKIAHKARVIVRQKHAMNKKERQMALDLLCQMAYLGMTISTNAPLAQEFVSSARTLQRAYRKHLAEKRRRDMHEMVYDDAKLHMQKDCEGKGLKVDTPVSLNAYFSYSSDSESATSSESESDSEYSESSEDESELSDDDEPMVDDDAISGVNELDTRNVLPQTRVSGKNLRRLRHACRAIGLSRKHIKQNVKDGLQSDFRVVSFSSKEVGVNRNLKNSGGKAPARRQQLGTRQGNSMGIGQIVPSDKDSGAGSSRPLITDEPRVTIAEDKAPLGSKIAGGQSHGLKGISADEATAAGRKAPNRARNSANDTMGGPTSTERQGIQRNCQQPLLVPLDHAPQVTEGSLTLSGTSAEAKAAEQKSSKNKSAAKLTPMRSKSCYEFRNDDSSASKALDSTMMVMQKLLATDAAQLSEGKRSVASYLQQGMQQGLPTNTRQTSTRRQPQRSQTVNMLRSDVGELASKSPTRRKPMSRLWDTGAREPSSTIWRERSLPRLSGTGLQTSSMVRSESSLPSATGSLPKLEMPGLPLTFNRISTGPRKAMPR